MIYYILTRQLGTMAYIALAVALICVIGGLQVHHSGTYAVLVTDVYHTYMFAHVQYAYKFEARSIIELRVKIHR